MTITVDTTKAPAAACTATAPGTYSCAELQQAIKDPRKKMDAMFLLGKAFQQKGLHDLALGQYEKALEAAGGGARAKEALYEMGAICEAQGKADDALRHFTKILEQDIGFRDVAQKVEALKG